MSPTPPIYKQPMFDYSSAHGHSGSYRKNSEGAALLMSNMAFPPQSSSFKSSSFPKKQNARKRILSSNEGYIFEHQKLRQFSGNLSNTKDSSTSSCAKYGSPTNKVNGCLSQEPKNSYLMKLRLCIKEKGEDGVDIDDLKKHISEISQDQIGSRFIQKVYEEASLDEK